MVLNLSLILVSRPLKIQCTASYRVLLAYLLVITDASKQLFTSPFQTMTWYRCTTLAAIVCTGSAGGYGTGCAHRTGWTAVLYRCYRARCGVHVTQLLAGSGSRGELINRLASATTIFIFIA